jgi:hypothetical protein
MSGFLSRTVLIGTAATDPQSAGSAIDAPQSTETTHADPYCLLRKTRPENLAGVLFDVGARSFVAGRRGSARVPFRPIDAVRIDHARL